MKNFFTDYEKLTDVSWNLTTVKRNKKQRFTKKEVQNIITFDIETSNGFRQPDGTTIGFSHELYKKNPEIYVKSTPVSLMYVWQSAVETGNDIFVFMGRTWAEYKMFLEILSEVVLCVSSGINVVGMPRPIRQTLTKSLKKTLPDVHVYVHNLGFEFQHLRNILNNEFSRSHRAVFARSMRKTMRAEATVAGCHLIYNDTLCLTVKSLKNWCKDEKLPVQKLEEPADYYLPVRTPETPLTPEEIAYSENDVVSMVYGMQKYRQKYGTLQNIPMTQTGEVRRQCQKLIAEQNEAWSNICAQVSLATSFDDYVKLNRCFVGGWTHANSLYTGRVMENVKCFDFRSSYPAVMCSRRFPVGEFTPLNMTDFETLRNTPVNSRTRLFYVEFTATNICSKTFNTFWSSSKCEELENPVLDNGKIYSCDKIKTIMTDLDFDIFSKVYSYDSINFHEMKSAPADYLPTEFIDTILTYYEHKTSLKGVAGAESRYAEAKQFINSIYGVCVTKIITDIVSFVFDWEKKEAGLMDYMESVSKSAKKGPFTTYQIGVWVTAWARHNLWDAIQHFDLKTVYCDTDSIKGLFTDEDLKWFDDYNANIWALCQQVASIRGIDIKKYAPVTPAGKVKELGYFDREDDCENFKTLGAKRYVDTVNGEIQCTIAGLPKASGVAKIHSIDDFQPDTVWDTEESGKLVSHYNDDQPICFWQDRDGKTFVSDDRYGICLQPTSFDMGMTEDYELFCSLMQGDELSDYFEIPKIMREMA